MLGLPLQVGNIHSQCDAKLDDMDQTHFSLAASAR